MRAASGEAVPLDARARGAIEARFLDMARRPLRTLALATRDARALPAELAEWRGEDADGGGDGELPAALGAISALRELLLNDNNLDGEVQRTLGKCVALHTLHLRNNHITVQVSV